MIRVDEPDEPEGFDGHVRQPGRAWLAEREGRPIRYPRTFWNEWRPCRERLEQAFGYRCGYAACWIPGGQVEHFESWKRCDADDRRHMAYEWSNYRWILPQLNGRKGTQELLDPYEVVDEWFELDLVSLNLDLTAQVPEDKRELAERTMNTLGLRRDPLLLKLREEALEMFAEGTSMAYLERFSPLVARALKRLFDAALESLSPAHRHIRAYLQRRRELASGGAG